MTRTDWNNSGARGEGSYDGVLWDKRTKNKKWAKDQRLILMGSTSLIETD